MGFFFLFWQYRNKCSQTWIVKMNNQSVCYRRLFVMSSFTKTIRGNICDRVPSSPWTAACRAASTRPWPFAESSGPVSGPSCTACLPWTPASTFQRLLGLTSQIKYLLTNLRSHIIYLCWLFNIELFCLICEFRYTPHLVCRLCLHLYLPPHPATALTFHIRLQTNPFFPPLPPTLCSMWPVLWFPQSWMKRPGACVCAQPLNSRRTMSTALVCYLHTEERLTQRERGCGGHGRSFTSGFFAKIINSIPHRINNSRWRECTGNLYCTQSLEYKKIVFLSYYCRLQSNKMTG